MSIQYAEVEMIHCTLAANTGSQGSGVIVTGAGAVPQLRVWNSIFWNEGPEEIIAYPENRVIQIEDSQVRGSWNGTGNSGLDPGFIDYSGGDFRLSESSPCLDTGKPNRSLQSLNGVPRPVDLPGIGADGADRGPDRGAFERPLEGHPTWTPTPTATITPTPTPDFDLVRDEVVNALDLLELLKQAKEAENGEVPLFEFNEYWLRSTTR